jgi:hypothetical protein
VFAPETMARNVAVALALLFAGANADVYTSTFNMKLSDTLPGNLLPQFKFQLGSIEGGSLYVNNGGGTGEVNPYTPFDTAPDEIWDHASTDLRAPSLPYLLQDQVSGLLFYFPNCFLLYLSTPFPFVCWLIGYSALTNIYCNIYINSGLVIVKTPMYQPLRTRMID